MRTAPPGLRGTAWRSARLRAREALGKDSSWAFLNQAPRTVGGRWSPCGAHDGPGASRRCPAQSWGREGNCQGDTEERCRDPPW